MPNDKIRDAIALNNLIVAVCQANDVRPFLSRARLLEVVVHFHKDVLKLEYHQDQEIALNKHIAGLAFWIRRLKPVQKAYMVNGTDDIIDINEQLSVWLMHELLILCADSDHAIPAMRTLPMSADVRGSRLEAYLARYWSLDSHFNYTSLVYNLRYRNISPHHMALLLDALTGGFVLKHTHFPEE